eukprot:2668669-Lingulodinium_polyedra.AAC.1
MPAAAPPVREVAAPLEDAEQACEQFAPPVQEVAAPSEQLSTPAKKPRKLITAGSPPPPPPPALEASK